MKRLLMYIVVAIVLVSAGFSIYYVVRNNEEIYSLIGDETFYMNVGETLEIPLAYEHPSSHTELKLSGGYESYLDVDLEKWTVTAKNPGMMTLKFTSTNEKYTEPFVLSFYIGNGSATSPYYIRNESDLLKIGTGEWSFSNCYELVEDITLTKPILPFGVSYDANGNRNKTQEFSGSLSGGIDRHKIINAKIVQGDLDYPSAGFFAIVGPNGKVENVVFENIYVEGRHSYAGTIAAANYGLIGKCEVRNGTVINTYEQGFTGGIVGLNQKYEGSDEYAQVNMCTSDVKITSKWVAGGAVGYNFGGVIFNSLVKTTALNIQVEDNSQVDYSYFGGISGISRTKPYDEGFYESYVSNSIAYIENIEKTNSHIAGVFGSYYGEKGAYEAEGNYNMLFYVAPSDIAPYYLHGDDQIISDSASSAKNYAKAISHEQALQKKTYTSVANNRWDFKNVWEIEEKTEIRIGYIRNDDEETKYQAFPMNGKVTVIETDSALADAFEEMRANPSRNMIFEVTKDVTFNGKGEAWEPIGSPAQPFKGQFKIADDVKVTIKNINVDAEFAGVFRCVAGVNTVIKNIVVSDSTFSGDVVGVIAARNDGATIDNCLVKDFSIKTTKYAGSIVGINSGNINECLVNAERYYADESGETVENPEDGYPRYKLAALNCEIVLDGEFSSNVYIGGIAGKNNIGGIIDVAGVQQFYITMTESANATAYIGGAVGYNYGNLVNWADISGMNIKAETFKGKAYVGGVVGMQATGEITYSTADEGNTIMFSLDNDQVMVGGIAGFTAENTAVRYCVADLIDITAHSAGGIVGISNGLIDQCYTGKECKIIGRYAGGFTCTLAGTITNSMTTATLSASDVMAGMTIYLRSGSQISYSYVDPLFSQQNGEKAKIYAETASEFRARPDRFGTITNTVIVGEYKVSDWVLFKFYPHDSITINKVEAKLQPKFGTFIDNVLFSAVENLGSTLSENGFIKGIWDLDNGTYKIPTKASLVKRSSFEGGEQSGGDAPAEGGEAEAA